LIANISGWEQDIVDQQKHWKLQSLPYMLTKFGELWSTNGEKCDRYFDPLNQYFGR